MCQSLFCCSSDSLHSAEELKLPPLAGGLSAMQKFRRKPPPTRIREFSQVAEYKVNIQKSRTSCILVDVHNETKDFHLQ